eukprot:TRINITY_DN19595_c0_g3_i1.p1 TRINITY_DN19595_c0_g3~~TRINITY_DN19595_c0_g3_i1.p1  ORF type:complete len:372 (+),score=57.00 TRINITY_DN19595_c0_g3_i1:75-1190(+)
MFWAARAFVCSEEFIRIHLVVAMNKFIRNTSGGWTLTAWTYDGEGETRSGSYEFDLQSGVLKDGEGVDIGTFSCEPVTHPLPLSLDSPADTPLECIDITNSEIMTEIQDPRNDGAYFVLPSQLNGAEYPGPRTIVQRIDDYKSDNTGGPRGQLAVHPGAGQFILDNAASDDRPDGINAIDEILHKCGETFTLVNGYLQMPVPSTEDEASKLLEAFRTNLNTLRPLVMENVPACGLKPDKMAFTSATHKVSLVYASAVPVSAYVNRASSPTQIDLHSKVAEGVLVAQYYGALKVAAARSTSSDKTKVFLMPLGGGVFNNPWESIAKGMALAVEMLSEDDHNKLDIRVLTWKGNNEEKLTMCKLLTRHKKLVE